ncbi:CHAT domain-containing protein [Psychroserpens ponticola]|uniref:CHAT domain-containing protein n=1 Tax=Psychroserpens ponticola TaxID=2932268 RepID=A0ABY7RWM0_9FLAO|nr:CHAT domain-containing tetratricopeptide repeat protein [Psychroserpens ponticola]WCO01541.1 CHAT domain-containing protein [Psychroserpens ponticola]
MKQFFDCPSHTILFILIVGLSQFGYSQQDSISGIKLIDYYLVSNDITKADVELKKQIQAFQNNNSLDSLVGYPYYVGKVSLAKTNKITAIKTAEKFVEDINSKSNNLNVNYKTLLSLADFYDEVSESEKSLEVTEEALRIAKNIKNIKGDAIGKIRYNVGACLMSLSEVEKAKTYFIDALKDYESYDKTDPKALSDTNNAIGATMWMSSKLDSAKHYYSKAIKALDLIKEEDSIENLYLKTVIKSNISLLEYSNGDFEQAIHTQTAVINNYETVANNLLDDNIVSKAKRYQARAISNLAVFYHESGNLYKANEILKYSLEKKKKMQNTASDIATTLIQIGQSQLSLQNLDEAITYLNSGLQQLEKISKNDNYWKATAFHALAEVYSAKNNNLKAKEFYDKSETLFLKTLGDEYDKEFLSFLSNKALFLAKSNDTEKAVEASQKAYNYVLKNGEDNSYQLFKQISNLAETYYLSKDYKRSQEWVQRGNDYLDNNIKNNTSSIDSLILQLNKPNLILLNSKSEYYTSQSRNVSFYKNEIKKLDEALNLLEQRKETIFNSEDINVLLSDYKNITDYSKKLNLELFEINNNTEHLKRLIELHESSIYNRIRSRLNMRNNLSFLHIPNAVLEREKELKFSISNSLEDTTNFNTFLNANNNWTTFLDSLKLEHPKYYKMRYASIETSIDNLQTNIPEQTTVIRYVYVEDQLYAFLVNKTDYNLIKLNSEEISALIISLNENQINDERINDYLFTLYNQLWKPFEDNIETKNIIIIPDGELFNLSFETLTSSKTTSFEDIAENSLISKYNMSYNYSLLLINENQKAIDYTNDFIAFVPEFNKTMKDNYTMSITDSLALDKTYLHLLPQPFSVELAKEYSKLFKGKSFINENASKQLFTTEANEHKIIHIGTHAESNNLLPELSRLVFAKEASGKDNSLYTYEIYNQNLSSHLAVLTACETGKPTHQAGEGMISLAHAFNYAGSESILTSLWKIDEQSSTKIIKLFYDNISEGIPKDEALRLAKLDYIKTADGRTKHPQYWAGLVLIGDTTPIDLQTSSNLVFWIIGFVIVLLLVLALKRKRKS